MVIRVSGHFLKVLLLVGTLQRRQMLLCKRILLQQGLDVRTMNWFVVNLKQVMRLLEYPSNHVQSQRVSTALQPKFGVLEIKFSGGGKCWELFMVIRY